MIKKVSSKDSLITRTAQGSIKAGANPCVCDCDSPGCTDWISQVAAIGGAALSTIVAEV